MKKYLFFVILVLVPYIFGAAGKFSFGIYSDLKSYSNGAHHSTVEALHQMGVDFSVLPGDLVDQPDGTPQKFDSLKTIGQKHNYFWPVVGNHDYNGGPGSSAENYAAYRQAFSFVQNQPGYFSGETTYYSFHHKGCHFICIDDMGLCQWKSDHPQRLWLEWLVTQDSVVNAEHIFIFVHYPLWGLPDSGGSRWEDCIDPYFTGMDNMTAIFGGDKHFVVKNRNNGIFLLTTPALCVPRTTSDYPDSILLPHQVFDESFSGYTWIEVDNGYVGCTLFDLNNELKYHWTVKDGNTTGSTESPTAGNRPAHALGLKVSPNPFNNKTSISVREKAELTIFDINGKVVKQFKPSRLRYTWNPTNVTTGIYILRVKYGARVIQKRLTLLK